MRSSSELTLLFPPRPPRKLISAPHHRRRALYGRDHPNSIDATCQLATLLQDHGALDESEALWREAVSCSSSALGPCHLGTLTAEINLGQILVTRQKLDEAEPLMRSTDAKCVDLSKRTRLEP